MPIQPTYPGVYVEEINSGVRTITGVSTSITAFIGRALRGPVNEPITINNYGDFERIFGGLWLNSTLGYAVRDFYLNEGSQAIIVRLFHPTDDKPAKASLNVNDLNLEAASEGAWGNFLRARIDSEVHPEEDRESIFNLTVVELNKDGNISQWEIFRNVSVKVDHPRRVDKVLLNESNLVRLKSNTLLPQQRPRAHVDPQGQIKLWGDNDTSTKVADADQGSDGGPIDENDFIGVGKEAAKQGLYALKKADLFNLLCIPPYRNDNQDI
ncbi:MAG: phage tail sheath family protein, partial [Nostoc sp.]